MLKPFTRKLDKDSLLTGSLGHEHVHCPALEEYIPDSSSHNNQTQRSVFRGDLSMCCWVYLYTVLYCTVLYCTVLYCTLSGTGYLMLGDAEMPPYLNPWVSHYQHFSQKLDRAVFCWYPHLMYLEVRNWCLWENIELTYFSSRHNISTTNLFCSIFHQLRKKPPPAHNDKKFPVKAE